MIKRILNLGAGVQSTTLYLMARENSEAAFEGMPLPYSEVGLIDVAVFADTGEEPKAVYEHLRWLQSLEWPEIVVATKGKLGDDLTRESSGKRVASIPAYTATADATKATGMVRRQCSREYKIEVIYAGIRGVMGVPKGQRVKPGLGVVQLVGISLDEAGRAARMRQGKHIPKWAELKFPLIERGMTRPDCLTWLKDRVPHQVPRSACVFCPYHSDDEWMRVKAVPEDWARAVEVDEGLRRVGSAANRSLDQKLFLHRSAQPLVQIEFKPKGDPREVQLPMNFTQECLGVCGV